MYPECLYLITNQGYIIIYVIASQTRPVDQSLTFIIDCIIFFVCFYLSLCEKSHFVLFIIDCIIFLYVFI